MMDNIPLIAAGAGLFGLLIATILYKKVNSIEIDNPKVAEITEEIQNGAMAFLFAEYKV
jgi:K(+)-stimulated pyrophosphate-energized sodium pump